MATKVSASHILVKTEAEAMQVLADLKAGKRFEDLAKAKSFCPSGRNGGSLGSFGKGMMVAEFEQACFAAGRKKGDIIGPVKTQFGFHIIRIDDLS